MDTGELTLIFGQDGSTFQSAMPAEEWEVPLHEVTAQSEEEATAAVDVEVGKAIVLEQMSMRLLVVHVGIDEHIVVLNIHHIATDAWSFPLLTTDMVTAYNMLVAGEPVKLQPEPRLSYVGYAQWQRALLSDEHTMRPHMQYWQDVLGGELPVLEIQTDHPRPAELTTEGEAVNVCVGAEASTKLQSLCKECGATAMKGI